MVLGQWCSGLQEDGRHSVLGRRRPSGASSPSVTTRELVVSFLRVKPPPHTPLPPSSLGPAHSPSSAHVRQYWGSHAT